MRYKLIIFDADETLFYFKKAEKETFQNTILEYDVDYDEILHFKEYKIINTAILI